MAAMSDTKRAIRGCVLVICNSFADTYGERTASCINDSNTMKDLWGYTLGCDSFPIEEDAGNTDFVVHQDISAHEMVKLIADFAKYKSQIEYSYIAVVISTYGGQAAENWVKKWDPTEKPDLSADSKNILDDYRRYKLDHERKDEKMVDVFFGNDYIPMSEEKVKALFSNDVAIGWQNIPKFFILNYSRGHTVDFGVQHIPRTKTQERIAHNLVEKDSPVPYLARREPELVMPMISDILSVHGCHHSHLSYSGNMEGPGSWLLSTVGRVFKKHAKRMHVVDMLTIVNHEMKNKVGMIGGGVVKMMSVYESSLDNMLYLSDEAKEFSEESRSTAQEYDSKNSKFAAKKNCDEVKKLIVEPCTEAELKVINKKIEKNSVYSVADYGKRGYVLVINNNFKSTEKERFGAEHDVKNLKELWNMLGCNVDVKEDATAFEMQEKFESLAKSEDLDYYDFLAVFVMSHGAGENGEDMVQGKDNKFVKMSDVFKLFSNKDCESMRGKPKLFFLQVCRGENVDEGVVCYADNAISDSIQGMEDIANRKPTMTDFLISYAAQYGYSSFRCMTSGSWFINAIANVFAKFAHEEHLADMMTKVQEAVSEKFGVYEDSPGIYKVCKQMSEKRDLLTKKLFLKPAGIFHTLKIVTAEE